MSKESSKIWYNNNKDKTKGYDSEKYQKNRLVIIERNKQYKLRKKALSLEVKELETNPIIDNCILEEQQKPKIIDFKPRKRYSVFHISEIMRKFPKHELNSKIIAKFTESDFKEFERLEQLYLN